MPNLAQMFNLGRFTAPATWDPRGTAEPGTGSRSEFHDIADRLRERAQPGRDEAARREPVGERRDDRSTSRRDDLEKSIGNDRRPERSERADRPERRERPGRPDRAGDDARPQPAQSGATTARVMVPADRGAQPDRLENVSADVTDVTDAATEVDTSAAQFVDADSSSPPADIDDITDPVMWSAHAIATPAHAPVAAVSLAASVAATVSASASQGAVPTASSYQDSSMPQTVAPVSSTGSGAVTAPAPAGLQGVQDLPTSPGSLAGDTVPPVSNPSTAPITPASGAEVTTTAAHAAVRAPVHVAEGAHPSGEVVAGETVEPTTNPGQRDLSEPLTASRGSTDTGHPAGAIAAQAARGDVDVAPATAAAAVAMTAAPATSGPAPAATMASTAIAGVDAAAPAASAQPVVAVALAPAPTSASRIEYAQVAAAVSSAVTPEHVEENTAHILGVARLLQRGEGAPSSMTLHLQPAHLGRVRVELRSLNGDLTVHLAAEHRSGVDIISAALPSLRASLEGDGVRVADVNVATDTSGGQDSSLAQRQAATDLADQRREHRPDGTPRHDGRGVASNDQDSTTPRMAPQPVDLADGALDLDL